MASPDDELQRYFRDLPMKVKRTLAKAIKDEADGLASAIRDEAPVGESGALRDSVRVRRGRNTLELVVEAGGPATTKQVRAGSGVSYDYALAQEYGTQKMPAQPLFYSTYQARRDGIEERIAAAVEDALG